MKKVTYLGPSDEVEIAEAGVSAKRGEPVEVSDEIAGRAPSTRKDPETEEVHQVPGQGLLAQPDTWRLEDASKPKKKPESAAAAPMIDEEA